MKLTFGIGLFECHFLLRVRSTQVPYVKENTRYVTRSAEIL